MQKLIFSFFTELVKDFTWTKLSLVVVVLLMLVSATISYEWYTNHLALSRMKREVVFLEKMTEISSADGFEKEHEDVRKAFTHVLNEFNSRYSEHSMKFGSLPPWTTKTLYSMLPWAFLALLLLLTTGSGQMSSIAGMLVVAIPLAIIGANIHDFESKWINYWLYPWVTGILSVIAITIWQGKKKT